MKSSRTPSSFRNRHVSCTIRVSSCRAESRGISAGNLARCPRSGITRAVRGSPLQLRASGIVAQIVLPASHSISRSCVTRTDVRAYLRNNPRSEVLGALLNHPRISKSTPDFDSAEGKRLSRAWQHASRSAAPFTPLTHVSGTPRHRPICRSSDSRKAPRTAELLAARISAHIHTVRQFTIP